MNPKHFPQKRFGQNFLKDTTVISQIIDAIHPNPEDFMVEIGPGLGSLTHALLQKVNHLDVIEIDRKLAAKLESTPHLTLHIQDVLKFDFEALQKQHPNKKLRIVGNLPYNISSPILFKLLDTQSIIQDMHFMLQKEVVHRIIASKGNREYGRLSVMIQYYCHTQFLFEVPARAFFPAPKVVSAFLRLIPKTTPDDTVSNFNLFKNLVNAAFQQRRKILLNSLKNYLTEEDFVVLKLDPKLRPEQLSVQNFVDISNYLQAKSLLGEG